MDPDVDDNRHSDTGLESRPTELLQSQKSTEQMWWIYFLREYNFSHPRNFMVAIPTCLMDLTAAVDPVEHSLLLTRLQKCFGIGGSCLEWFSSYLSGRSYYVVVDDVSSKVTCIIWSVPQGRSLDRFSSSYGGI